MAINEQIILQVLQTAVQHGVSDIHLATGQAPAFRMKDGIAPLQMEPFTHEDMLLFCRLMIQDPAEREKVPTLMDFDGSFEVQNLARFRFNIYRQQKTLSAVLRVIKLHVPTVDDLKLPQVLKKIAQYPRGLILVTGATGSGKSSTLAAMINEINHTRGAHIVTIEDPVEFVHQSKVSRISQREVGTDTESFARAMKSALRQDPDVILVGELRDVETMDIALKAAETGHTVFSTVHTTDAIKTIGRVVAMYPAEEQKMVRLRLADNQKSTISQRLVNRADGSGKVVAMEIMVSNFSIQECIANPAKTGEMNNFIEQAKERLGSQTFDQHLSELYTDGTLTFEIAMAAATNPADFERNVTFGSNQGRAAPGTGAHEVQAIEMEAESDGVEVKDDGGEESQIQTGKEAMSDAASQMQNTVQAEAHSHIPDGPITEAKGAEDINPLREGERSMIVQIPGKGGPGKGGKAA